MKKKSRALTDGEIAIAKTIFGDQLDYKKIRIKNRRIPGQPKSGGMCTMNTINISGPAYSDDYSKQNLNLRGFFIHEMTHIWQYQDNAMNLTKNFLKAITKHHVNYMRDAYDYEFEKTKQFKNFNHEQQACIVQDYYVLKNLPKPTSIPSFRYSGRCQNLNICENTLAERAEHILRPVFKNLNPKTPPKTLKTTPPKR